MRGSEVRSLLSPDHHEPLCSCSPPCLSVFLGFRAEDKATAHNRVVLGSENLPSRSIVNQALGDAVAIGVLGNPAIALCAVPLLIPVSALIWAHERP